MSTSLIVDVEVGGHSNQLMLRPRDPSSRNLVTSTLRSNKIIPRITAEGIALPLKDGSRLGSVSGIDFRVSSSAARAIDNRLTTSQSLDATRTAIRQLMTDGLPMAKALLSDIRGLEKLDAHQWVNVAAMTLPGAPGLCLFDEQGLGKTVSCIYAFDVLVDRNEVDFALVVAPKSMVPEWPHDFARFFGDNYRVSIMAGTRQEKLGALSSRADVIVTNYETIVSMEREIQAHLATRNGRNLLIVDESFFAKNLDARRTSSLRRVREYCRRAFVLCGTPAPNSPLDVIQQFNLADFGSTFEAITVPKEREKAHEIISTVLEDKGLFIRHLKSNALPNLPCKRFSRVFVSLAPVQSEMYGDALEGYLHDLESSDDTSFARDLTNFLARRTVLLQICSNPLALSEGYDETPSKLAALDLLLGELVGRQREKVLVWSAFRRSIDAIMERFARFKPVRYDGAVGDVSERREAVRRFQEDDETMLFVANPAAAGAGLTLHRANHAIYESLSNQAAQYLQSIDRIHRRGQAREVEYIVLLCEGTIEIQHYEALLLKEKSAADLLGDPLSTSLTREMLIAEARESMF